jgi:hypothetical protein
VSAVPVRQLYAVDPQTGEISEYACVSCQRKEDELAELWRKFRGQSRELAELRRDRDAEARAHRAWPVLLMLFDYYKVLTGHGRARWTPDRFWCALGLWREFGSGNCAAGIAGIAYDPNRKQLKNGRFEVFDSWELLFRNSGTFERYCRRRPKDWVCPASLCTTEIRLLS